MSAGTSAKSSTTADQNSTLVARTRSGLRAVQLGERRLLERLGHLVAARAELLGSPAQHPGPRVLGAVDAVAEAHQPLAAVEGFLDPALGVAGPSTSSSIVSTRDGAPPCSGPDRAPTAPDSAAAHVGAGRGDHPRGEGRGVHAVLGGGDPVGVDRLDVVGVGLAPPAHQEPLGDGGAGRSSPGAPAAGRGRGRTGRRTRAPSPMPVPGRRVPGRR